MNTPKSGIDLPSQKSYPQVESLFASLNISAQDRENIQSEFYNIAKIVYGNPKEVSHDTIMKMKLWEKNPDSFTILDDHEWDIIGQYLNFIQSYPDWEEIWRVLSAYYNPNQA